MLEVMAPSPILANTVITSTALVPIGVFSADKDEDIG